MDRPSRYPELRRGPDGRKRCRGCGGEIPPRQDGGEDKRKTWCGEECHKKYDPRWVFAKVRERANGKCEKCGSPHPYEYDHIIPFSEGGPTTIENIQLLCTPCHATKTRAWHSARAKQRRKERQPLPLFDEIGGLE